MGICVQNFESLLLTVWLAVINIYILHNITTPFARTNMRANSYFVHTSKNFNHVSKNIKVTGVSLLSFKSNCRKYLLEQDQP